MSEAGNANVLAAADNSETLPLRAMVSEFEVLGVIGEGGFGTVYLAMDHSLNRKVALKEYRPAALATRTGQTVVLRSQKHADSFAAGLRSFINEARTLARFDHPALVRVHRFWQENGTAYMAMPLVSGRTLTAMVRDYRAEVTEAWLRQILAPLLDAIEALHGVQIFHRDIAPDNVLIQDNGVPVLLDFGAAREIVADMSQALTVILKPGYAPIEQYAEDAVLKQGPWTDIYALGAVLHFAVTGRPPSNSVTRLAHDSLTPLAVAKPPGFSTAFLAAIDHALAVRPEARPQSIAELRKLFDLGARAVRAPAPMPAVDSLDASIVADPPEPPESPTTVMLPRTIVARQGGTSAPASIGPATTGGEGAVSAPTPLPLTAPPQPAVADREATPVPSRSRTGIIAGLLAVVVLGAIGLFAFLPKQGAVPAVAPETAASAPGGPAVDQRPTGSAAPAATDTGAAAAAPASPVAPAASAAPAAPTAPAASTAPATTGAPTPPAVAGDAGAQAVPAAAPPVPEATGTGVVRLAVKPWAMVRIDGVEKAVTPPLKSLTLPVGKHVIELVNSGFPPHAVEVQVEKDKRITLSYEFK
jgi:non-specific serine/threonine protein kinase